jgi:murein DD-endopeptidase MepM/ murein hydrolase activator NlpD
MSLTTPSRQNRARLLALLTALLCGAGCRAVNRAGHGAEASPLEAARITPRPAHVFDDYLRNEMTPADGFDFPVGDADGEGYYTDSATGKRHDGWYVATHFAEHYSLGIHPGEDWNGRGGGNTDFGQPVYAVANGRVVVAEQCGQPWGNVVVIEHVFYENHEKFRIRSLYAHLSEIKVRRGDEVKRRQLIATVGQDPQQTFPAHLHLEMRWDASLAPTYWPSSHGKDEAWVREHYAEPTAFIRSRRTLPVPSRESTLVLVDQAGYKMRLYERGEMRGEYSVSFGQQRGRKRVQGDNKTPQGMYFVINKHRGRFDGEYGAYYGGHWIKVNYPNKYDAAYGQANSLITERQAAAISASWERRAPTLENTRLGGGIGFHGWVREWPDDGPRHLSWGCVVMHIYDIKNVFDRVPPGAMVVIF